MKVKHTERHKNKTEEQMHEQKVEKESEIVNV